MVKNSKTRGCDTSFDTENVKNDLVNRVLKHAKFDGFSIESLHAGANDIGLDTTNANALFPSPANDIPAHWAIMLDQQTAEFGKTLKTSMRIRDKISSLVKHRIQCLAPHTVCLKLILGHMAMPNNSAVAMHALYNTADAMWVSIGDNTPNTDRNYYTKRGILSAVLFASVSFYIGDTDNDIDRYIEDRIDNALQLGKLKNIETLEDFKQYLPYMNHPLKMRD